MQPGEVASGVEKGGEQQTDASGDGIMANPGDTISSVVPGTKKRTRGGVGGGATSQKGVAVNGTKRTKTRAAAAAAAAAASPAVRDAVRPQEVEGDGNGGNGMGEKDVDAEGEIVDELMNENGGGSGNESSA